MSFFSKKGGIIMNEISFQSTFRIPVAQNGMNNTKKLQLKALISSYKNGLTGNGSFDYARISLKNSEDTSFLKKLETIGYKTYQIFKGEDIPKKNLDNYIKSCLKVNNYKKI